MQKMFLRTIFGFVLLFSNFWFRVEGGGGLSYDFYERTCPQVEEIVRAGIQSLHLSDPTSPSALLRLMFHDCQVQGCDASILLDPMDATSSSEMASPKNFGVRNRETISVLKSMVEAVCPQRVSCSDILILAARDAVSISGGPHIQVPLGRKDSFAPPTYELATFLLPPPSLGVDGTLGIFAKKGMSIQETVAILGAHTLGITHCLNIPTLPNSPQLSQPPGFEAMLRLSCPFGPLTPNTSFVVNDPTSLIFDNQYYVNIMGGRGILRVDAELPLDPRTAPFVQLFAADQDQFFRVFSSAFRKLSSFGVLIGDQGVIRGICSVIS